MAEAAAFGVAVGVIQLIDYGAKLLKTGVQIYTATDAEGVDRSQLENVTANLASLLDRVRAQGPAASATDEQVVEDAKAVSAELLEAVQRVSRRCRQDDEPHVWDSFRAALTVTTSRERIERLEIRLDRLRQQLQTNMLARVADRIDVIEQHTALLVGRSPPPKPSSGDRAAMVEEMLQQARARDGSGSLVGSLDHGPGTTNQNFSRVRRRRRRAPNEPDDPLTYEDFEKFSQRLASGEALQSPNRRIKIASDTPTRDFCEALFPSLWFTGMDDRQLRVAKAYQKTYHWVLEDEGLQARSWSSFTEWLSQPASIYWITGKPGSGKSTMMKYIYHQPRFMELLEDWTGSKPLVVAAFFFWISGNQLQRSEKGLLQSLLLQVLEQAPELAPDLLPSRWFLFKVFGSMPPDMQWSELVVAIELIMTDACKNVNFCFMIDGLDEFEGHHTELIDLVKRLAARPNIKVCAASRPWPVFEDAFKRGPNLMLEDLTHPDITYYVQTKFSENDGFKELRQREPTVASQILDDVARKATGVFLWVVLVVRSLLEGLTNGDNAKDLQQRLDRTPEDLEGLFESLLGSLEPLYRGQASQMLQLVQAAASPPTLLLMSFAIEHSSQTTYLADLEPSTDLKRLLKCRNTCRLLISRCRGLLEPTITVAHDDSVRSISSGRTDVDDLNEDEIRAHASVISSLQVQYLHRTFKDFVESSTIRQWLVAMCQTLYDPYRALCKAHISIISANSALSSFHFGDYSIFTDFVGSEALKSIDYALQAEKTHGEDTSQLLAELDKCALHVDELTYRRFITMVLIDEENKVWKPYSEPLRQCQAPTLMLAAMCGLHSYIRYLTETPSFQIDQEQRGLLLVAAQTGISNADRFGPFLNFSDSDPLDEGTKSKTLAAVRSIKPGNATESSSVPLDALSDRTREPLGTLLAASPNNGAPSPPQTLPTPSPTPSQETPTRQHWRSRLKARFRT